MDVNQLASVRSADQDSFCLQTGIIKKENRISLEFELVLNLYHAQPDIVFWKQCGSGSADF